MRRLLLLIGLFMFFGAYSQTTVFQENFDGATVQFTSSAGTGTTSWALSDSYSTSGTYSDSATVAANDHLYLTSNSFNTTGNMNVLLEFEHICKIEFFDSAYIEVSNDNGATWSTVTQSMYLGANPSAYLYNKFSSGSYVIWDAATNNATPTNAWWMPEQFDISSLAANSANVKIRFVLADGNINGANSAIGWFIDDVKVDMAPDELIPPVVAFNSPILANDTVYNANPILIDAMIKDDGSGIDTAYVAYTVNGVNDTVGFAPYQADTMRATVPFIGFGRTLEYHIVAIDASLNANTTVLPATGNRSIYAKFTPGIQIVALQESFENGFPGTWTQSSTDDFDWTNYSGSTTSSPTGPTSAHDGSYYMYTETSPSATWNATSIIETPSINIDTLISPVMSFYYHMMGATIGSLNIDIYDGSSWTTGVFVLTGQQQSAEADPWMEATVDLTSYKSTTTKIRFRAETGSSFTGDIAIDLVKVGDGAIPQPDAGIEEISYPTGGILANSNFDVKVRAKNWSSDTLTSFDVNWEVDGTAQTTYSSTTSVLPGMLSDTLTLGTQNLSSGTHTLKVWTANPNNNIDFNTSNDTMHFSFYGCANLLSGTYTIGGTGADYPTFADAALALNQCGISAPVTFNVAAGTYTEQFELEDISGSSATNTITFQSATGDSSSVIVEFEASSGSDNYVVRLNETKYTTFTEMTFQSLDTTYGKVFDVMGAASDLMFTNNVIQTTMPGIDGSADMALIYAPGGVGDNITIQNNLFTKGSSAITLTGATSSNWDISNNIIEGHYGAGIVLGNAVSPIVKYNRIVADTASLSDSYNGIVVDNGSGAAEVSYNYIRTDATHISYGITINSGTYDSLSPAMVYNNMISLYGSSTANTLSCGLLNYGAKNVNYYYNTSHFEGSQSNAANMSIYENGNNTGNINVINNIFTNNAGGYIYYNVGVDSTKFTVNYNNLYNWGSGTFAYLGADISDLSGWQTETGGAQNSVSYEPFYASIQDLSASNNYLNDIGTPIASITDDYYGNIRNTTTPDMGAVEFDASPYDVAALQLLTPIGACGLDTNEVVTLQLKNIGSDTISGNLTAKYKVLQSTASPVSESITASINPTDTFVYTFTTPIDLDVTSYGADSTFNLIAWLELLNDPVQQNDTTYFDVNSRYQPPSPITSDTSVVYGNSITLTAQSNDSLIWYQYDTSATELERTNNFTTPLLYDTTTYWVSAGGGAGQLLITEIVQFETGTGYTNPYPSWITGVTSGDFDGVEMTNVGSGPLDLTGYTLNFQSTNSSWGVNGTFTFPAGAVIPPGGITVVDIKSASSVNDMSNLYFGAGLSGNPQSSADQGYYLEDPSGNVIDAVATNGHTFAASTGVTAADWSGAIASSSGRAGVTRLVIDNNTASDWGIAGTNPTMQSFGSPNPMLPVNAGGSVSTCESARVPLTVNVTGFPTEDAGISEILNPGLTAMSGIYHDVEVVLNNYAIDTLTNVDIIYSIQGLFTDTFNYAGSLAYTDSDTIVIDSVNLNGGVYTLITYTDMPNNIQDTINTNDTSYLVFNSCLNGTYTIGDTTGGVYNDFVNFTDAVNALLNAGVCGNVTFLADSGIYNEQITITEIPGVDANNTVTFTSKNGDSTSVILEYAATSSASAHTVYLDGADYITFSKITLKASGSSYGRTVTMDNDATNNNFYNNVFDMPQSTSSYMAGIYSYDGNDDSTKIINNHFKNGGYGIYMRGDANTNRERGTHIENNYIDGPGYYAIYSYYQDSLQFLNNVVREGSNSNYFYGMYFGYTFDNFRIANNIFNAIDGGTSTKYGLRMYYSNYYPYYDPATDGPGYVYNNMINVRSGTGTKYAFYTYYGNDLHVYYNTFKISGGGSTARAMYQYNSTSTQVGEYFINNNFIDSVGYEAIYIGEATTINTMDYNNYYTEGGDIADWDGTTAPTLSDLQTASGKDANSLNVNPTFMASDDLHLLSTQLSGYGMPLTDVTTDIDGEPRSTIATTIGADEVPLLPVDIGVAEILYLPDTTYEGYSYTLSAVVKNYGTDTVVGYQVDYTINGGTPVVNGFPTDSLHTGGIDTVPLASFNSPAGASIFCATTVLTADTNYFNDGNCQNFFGVPVKDAYVTAIDDIDGGCGIGLDTVNIWIKNIGIDTINGPGQTAQPTVHFMNDLGVGATVITENFNSVVNPGDSVYYTFVTLVDLTNNTQYDSVFTVTAWINYPGDNVTYNDTVYTDVNSLHIPNDPVFTTPVSVPYGTSVTLPATSLDSIYWYLTDTSSDHFHMGSSYTTGFNYNDTSYWISAETQGGSPIVITEIEVGSDHIEIQNVSGSTFDATGWQVLISDDYSNINDVNTDTWTLGVMQANEADWRGDVSGANDWGANMFWNGSGSSGWAMIIDDQGVVMDFVAWDWTYNDILGMSVNAGGFTGLNPILPDERWIGDGFSFNSCSSTQYRVNVDMNDATDFVCQTHDRGIPNIMTNNGGGGGAGCSSNRVEYEIVVTAQQDNDVSAYDLLDPVSSIYLTNAESVTAQVRNFGLLSQTNIPVSLELGGTHIVTDTIPGPLASGASVNHTFSQTVDLSNVGGTYGFTVYTSLPTDTNPLNDTLNELVTNMVPNYCESRATSSTGNDITNVTFAGINNSSTAPNSAGYSDYTSTTAGVVNPSGMFNISIELGASSSTSWDEGYVEVYMDVNKDGTFTEPDEIIFGQQYTQSPTTSPITLSGTVNIPFNALDGTTRLRIVNENYLNPITATDVVPCGTYSYGETEDYSLTVLPSSPIDVGVEMVSNPPVITDVPTQNLVGYARNYGSNPQDTIEVFYTLNGSLSSNNFIAPAPLNLGDSLGFVFPNITLSQGLNQICVYTQKAGDTNTFNDSVCLTSYLEVVTPAPTCYNFDDSITVWFPDTLDNQWEWGAPAGQTLNTAHSSPNVWATRLSSAYEQTTTSGQYLYSPKFLIDNTTDSLMLEFWHILDLDGNDDDRGYIQWSESGSNWQSVGIENDPKGTNWYDATLVGTPCFTTTNNTWMKSSYNIDFLTSTSPFSGVDTIQFRFVFTSDGTTTSSEGWMIDDFCFTMVPIAKDAHVMAINAPAANQATGSTVTPKVDVYNAGTQALSSIDMSYTINGNTANTITETWTPSPPIAPGATVEFTFNTSYTSLNIDYPIFVEADATGDIYHYNDTMTKFINQTPADYDAMISEIVYPWDTTSVNPDCSPIVIVEIKNIGVNTLTSIPVEYEVYSQTYQDVWTGSLDPGDSVTYEFSMGYTSQLGNYQLCARTALTNDGNPGNDETCKSLLGVVNYCDTVVNGISDGIIPGFILGQNQPNPALGKYEIEYELPNSGQIHFEIRNSLGQIIYKEEGFRKAGVHTLKLDAADLANGVYYYSMDYNKARLTRKMVITK